MTNAFKAAVATTVVVLAGLPASSASAATSLGEVFDPPTQYGGGGMFIQQASPANNYAAPTDGVITSWSFQASVNATPPLKLKMMRAAGGDDYTVVGQSQLESPVVSTVNTWNTRVPVKAGDFLGIHYSDSTYGFRSSGAGFQAPYNSIDPATGSTDPYTQYAGGQIDLAANLEADADGDGFGDETQDQCPTDASTQGQCQDRTAPQTNIDKAPKAKIKTKKKKAKISISFSSSESSTFSCTLDGDEGSCTSPFKAKVGKGKHTFSVVATDSAGNADSSPATVKFKVKRKKS